MSYKAKSNVSDDVSKMRRVDHAGEYGAVAIYRGQQAVFMHNPKTASTASKLSEMEQEDSDPDQKMKRPKNPTEAWLRVAERMRKRAKSAS